MTNKKEKMEKIVKNVINVVLDFIIVIGAIFIFLYIIGIHPFVFISESMEPQIHTNSVVFIDTKYKFNKVKENDIIGYKLDNGTIVTHRAKKITSQGIETKGDANGVSDGVSTTEDNFLGKVVFIIPKIGTLFTAASTADGRITFLILLVILFATGMILDEDDKRNRKKASNNSFNLEKIQNKNNQEQNNDKSNEIDIIDELEFKFIDETDKNKIDEIKNAIIKEREIAKYRQMANKYKKENLK